MPSPWLSIPLDDYEGHMSSGHVQQLTALSELFKHALDFCRPESVAVLGIAGGNGLDRIDPAVTKRIVGVDINQIYLDEVRRRYGNLAGLELHRADLAAAHLNLAPVALVHAALIFEHAGVITALKNALSLVVPGGRISVVLQLPSAEEPGIASTSYTSMQTLKDDFKLMEPGNLQQILEGKGFRQVDQKTRRLPAGKALWLGIFE